MIVPAPESFEILRQTELEDPEMEELRKAIVASKSRKEAFRTLKAFVTRCFDINVFLYVGSPLFEAFERAYDIMYLEFNEQLRRM